MKNLQDGGFGGDLIHHSVKDDNSEKQLNDQKAEVGNDGDTPNKAPSLPPGVTIKKGNAQSKINWSTRPNALGKSYCPCLCFMLTVLQLYFRAE